MGMIGNAIDRLLMDTIYDAILIASDPRTNAEDRLDAHHIVSMILEMMKQRRQTPKEEVAAALKKVEAAFCNEPELRLIVEEYLDSWDRPKPLSTPNRDVKPTFEEVKCLLAAIDEVGGLEAKEGGGDQSPARCIDPFDPLATEPAASLDSDMFPLPPMLQAEKI